MKHITVVVILIAIVTISMTSCLSLLSSDSSGAKIAAYTFDESIPAEQSAKIRISGIRPTSYNGINIDNALAKDADIFNMIMPAGDALFEFSFYMFRDNGRTIIRYFIPDNKFQYKFESGKEYRVSLYREPKPKEAFKPQENLYYVRIYENRQLSDLKPEELKHYYEEEYLASIFLFDSTDIK